MSTKTNFKRIALVAVASLGLGLLSSAPSQAIVSVPTLSGVADGTGGVTVDVIQDSLTAATLTVSAFMDTDGDSLTVQVVPSNTNAETTTVNALMYLTDTGFAGTAVDTSNARVAGSTAASTVVGNQRLVNAVMAKTDTVGVVAGVPNGLFTIKRDTAIATAGNVKASFMLQIDSSPAASNVVPGTYTYTVNLRSYDAGSASSRSVQQTINIVISRSAAATLALSATANPATSWLTMGNTLANLGGASDNDTTRSTTDSSISVVSTAAATDHAVVRVSLRNVSSGNAQESVTATITAGRIGDGTTMGRSVVLPYTAAEVVLGFKDLVVEADGTAAVATITVSTTSVTFPTKSVIFYAAAPSKLVITTATPLLQVGTNDDAVRVTATDANGSVFAGALYSYAAVTTVAGTARTSLTTCTFDSADQRHECSITGTTAGTATITISNYASATAATAAANGAEVTGTATVVVSTAVAATVKVEFDKATYAPGERARIYVTPLDSTGKAIQVGNYTNLLATGGITTASALTFAGSSTTADSLTAVTITTKANSSATTGARAGSMEYTVFMPVAGGSVTISATGGAGLPAAGQVATTATATVTDSGAAALAAVNALATTVASLRTLITTLTNLVLKIQKKVKA